VKRLSRLGLDMSNIFYTQVDVEPRLQAIHDALAEIAMKVSGVRADELADEEMESKPIVRLYWTTLAELTAKMFIEAAQHQSYYREAD
jgi:hypothetical protein